MPSLVVSTQFSLLQKEVEGSLSKSQNQKQIAQQAVNVLAKFDAAKMPLVTSQPHQQTTKGYIYFDFLVSSVLKVIYPSVHRVLALRGGNI